MLQELPDIHITLDDIVVVRATDPLILELRSAVPSGYPIQGSDVTVPVRNYASYLPDSAATATLHILRLAQDDARRIQDKPSD